MTRKAVLLALCCLLVGGVATGSSKEPSTLQGTQFHYLPVSLMREEDVSDSAQVIRDFSLPSLPISSNTRPIPRIPASKTHVQLILSSVKMPSVAVAKAWAKAELNPAEYLCLDQIFKHESNWDPYELNESSGAYGIPQALPGSKMAWAGSDWRTNPLTQVRWGIHYMRVRYGSPCAAWDFWLRNRWY